MRIVAQPGRDKAQPAATQDKGGSERGDAMSGVLLVTGGSRGVGAAICRTCAELGYAVSVNFRTNEQLAKTVVDAIVGRGGKAIAVQGDVTREPEIVAMFDRLDRTFGRITGLVNNAGGGVGIGPVAETTPVQIEAAIALNLTGPILCARGGSPNVNRTRRRRWCNHQRLFDVGIQRWHGGLANYAAAKGGLESFTIALANEVGRDGIRVNRIRLGAMETDAHMNDTAEWRAAMTATIVLRRYGKPEEVANAAAFLLSD
jgi:NAD(P)-dependent dehydrogenase (short-subunit alcohol dehydrogenase family)